MDELHIKTKFMKNMVGKFLAKTILKIFGAELSFGINELDIGECEDKTGYRIHMDLDVDVSKEQLMAILGRSLL